MKDIAELLGDHFILVLLLGAVFFLAGTVGAIRIKSIELSLDVYPRIALTVAGIALLGLTVLTPQLAGRSADIRDNLLSSGGIYRFYWSEQNWVGEMIFKEGPKEKVLVSMEVYKQFVAKGSSRASETSASIPVINTLNEGTVQLVNEGLRINNITISHNYFDTLNMDGFKIEGMEIAGQNNVEFSAEALKPIVAYGGHVTYKNLDANTIHRAFLVITKCELGCED